MDFHIFIKKKLKTKNNFFLKIKKINPETKRYKKKLIKDFLNKKKQDNSVKENNNSAFY